MSIFVTLGLHPKVLWIIFFFVLSNWPNYCIIHSLFVKSCKNIHSRYTKNQNNMHKLIFDIDLCARLFFIIPEVNVIPLTLLTTFSFLVSSNCPKYCHCLIKGKKKTLCKLVHELHILEIPTFIQDVPTRINICATYL